MISQEEYDFIKTEMEEKERQRVARKVKCKNFASVPTCPRCGEYVHSIYNKKYCGNCMTPLDWD